MEVIIESRPVLSARGVKALFNGQTVVVVDAKTLKPLKTVEADEVVVNPPQFTRDGKKWIWEAYKNGELVCRGAVVSKSDLLFEDIVVQV